jgi:hypothetical protein
LLLLDAWLYALCNNFFLHVHPCGQTVALPSVEHPWNIS